MHLSPWSLSPALPLLPQLLPLQLLLCALTVSNEVCMCIFCFRACACVAWVSVRFGPDNTLTEVTRAPRPLQLTTLTSISMRFSVVNLFGQPCVSILTMGLVALGAVGFAGQWCGERPRHSIAVYIVRIRVRFCVVLRIAA